jgi:hypothetical protein
MGNEVQPDDYWMVDFQVNGVDAEVEEFEHKCVILWHHDGYRFDANDDGRYNLRIRINPERAVSTIDPLAITSLGGSSQEVKTSRTYNLLQISSIIIL